MRSYTLNCIQSMGMDIENVIVVLDPSRLYDFILTKRHVPSDRTSHLSAACEAFRHFLPWTSCFSLFMVDTARR